MSRLRSAKRLRHLSAEQGVRAVFGEHNDPACLAAWVIRPCVREVVGTILARVREGLGLAKLVLGEHLSGDAILD